MSTIDICPVCEFSDKYFKVLKKQNDYLFCQCKICKLLFIKNLPYYFATEWPEEFYSYSNYINFINAFGKNIDYETQLEIESSIALQRVKNQLNYLKKFKGNIDNVLDIGCSYGSWGNAFKKEGVYYLGIDIDKNYVETANRHGINVINSDFVEKGVPNINKHFDIIFAHQVLEHIFKPNKFIKQIKKYLTKDGILLIDVPNPDGFVPQLKELKIIKKQFNPEFLFLQPPAHYMAYKKETIEYLLAKHNFKIQLIRSYSSNHTILGRLKRYGVISSLLLSLMTFMNKGSLLVCCASKTD